MLAVVHHLDPPVLGHAGDAFAAAGAPLLEVSPHAGDPLPRLDDLDAIVSLGGAQSVLDIDRDPALAAEARWLARAVREHDVPVLGVCLGAQLLAHALGGSVRRLERRRLTWLRLEPTAAGRADALLGALPPGAHGLHWNEDGLEPPPGSVELLRRRAGAECVAFRHGAHAWGVQFHPEIDAGALDGWYAGWTHAPGEAGVTEPDARRLDEIHLPGQRALADALFGSFARIAAASRSAA